MMGIKQQKDRFRRLRCSFDVRPVFCADSAVAPGQSGLSSSRVTGELNEMGAQ